MYSNIFTYPSDEYSPTSLSSFSYSPPQSLSWDIPSYNSFDLSSKRSPPPLLPGSTGSSPPRRLGAGGPGGQRRKSVGDGRRCQLLEDFRNGRVTAIELGDVQGHVVDFAKDQHGSRFIQQKLEQCSNDEKEMVFSEVLPASYSLITDVFGNYVIQKFFEFGTLDQKATLVDKLHGHVPALSLHTYGCRVIQKAIESVPPYLQVLSLTLYYILTYYHVSYRPR